MRIFDNLLAIRILYLLVTPFEKTPAYKLGLISKDGEFLKKAKTPEEINATSMLHRLVWRVKRFINMVPGGSTKIGSMVAAYALVRECVEKYNSDPTAIQLIEAKITGRSTDVTEEVAANATGAATSTDQATVKLKNKPFKRFDTDKKLPEDGKITVRRMSSLINMESEDGAATFEFIRANPSGILVLESDTEAKILQYEYFKETWAFGTPKYEIEVRNLW